MTRISIRLSQWPTQENFKFQFLLGTYNYNNIKFNHKKKVGFLHCFLWFFKFFVCCCCCLFSFISYFLSLSEHYNRVTDWKWKPLYWSHPLLRLEIIYTYFWKVYCLLCFIFLMVLIFFYLCFLNKKKDCILLENKPILSISFLHRCFLCSCHCRGSHFTVNKATFCKWDAKAKQGQLWRILSWHKV